MHGNPGITDSLTISVVICAYTEQRWSELVAAVKSVEAQTVRPLEIIVVVDYNSNLLERTRQQFPSVIVIENQELRGLSGARNSGVAVAQGEIIAFLDDDAVAAPDWLSVLRSSYVDAQVMCAGGAIDPMWITGRPAWFPEEFDWVVGCTYRGMPETLTSVRNLIGCNMSCRREAFAAVGGFHWKIGRLGTIPLSCEETEWCIRLSQHLPQARLCYNPAARVAQWVPEARSNWRYGLRRCYLEGISKALVSNMVGASRGLSAEWHYTLHVLPAGVWRGFTDAIVRRDPAGLLRAAVICVGLAVTTAGYVHGRVSSAWAAQRKKFGRLRKQEQQR